MVCACVHTLHAYTHIHTYTQPLTHIYICIYTHTHTQYLHESCNSKFFTAVVVMHYIYHQSTYILPFFQVRYQCPPLYRMIVCQCKYGRIVVTNSIRVHSGHNHKYDGLLQAIISMHVIGLAKSGLHICTLINYI